MTKVSTSATGLQLSAPWPVWRSPARAVLITNQTTSTTLFSDNFESGDLLHPSAGSWSIGVGAPGVSVNNSASPGAAEGSYYVEANRQTQFTNDEGNLQAQLSGVQSNSGDVIELRMMVYMPSSTDVNARGVFILDDGNFQSARAWVETNGAGHVMAVGPGFVLTDTGLTYATEKWQEWDLSYAIGASTFSVAVNGVSAAGFTSETRGSVGFADLLNGAFDPGGSLFLDAVPAGTGGTGTPEPGGLSLGALATLAVGLGLWQKR